MIGHMGLQVLTGSLDCPGFVPSPGYSRDAWTEVSTCADWVLGLVRSPWYSRDDRTDGTDWVLRLSRDCPQSWMLGQRCLPVLTGSLDCPGIVRSPGYSRDAWTEGSTSADWVLSRAVPDTPGMLGQMVGPWTDCEHPGYSRDNGSTSTDWVFRLSRDCPKSWVLWGCLVRGVGYSRDAQTAQMGLQVLT